MSTVTIIDGVLTMDALTTKDEVSVRYIGALSAEEREQGVINCLQLGARALTFANDQTSTTLLADTFKKELKTESYAAQQLLSHVAKTAQAAVVKSSETLETAISELLEDLTKDLSRTLDPANAESIIGKLRAALVNDYRGITAKVREDLDPRNVHSPLSALRTELESNQERRHALLSAQLNELLQRLAAKAAAQAERSKSTRKGGDFEAAAHDFLMSDSAARKDLVMYTGKEYGLDQNLVGDFVVEVNPAEAHKLRIVLETKNAQKNGTAERLRELEKAASNRGAVFGISVLASDSEVGRAIQPVGDDKIIVYVQSLPDGSGWDFTALGVALECARFKALMGRRAVGSFDIAKLTAEIDRAFAITNAFADVKRKVSASMTQLDGIADCLDGIKLQLNAALQAIRTLVNDAQPDHEAA